MKSFQICWMAVVCTILDITGSHAQSPNINLLSPQEWDRIDLEQPIYTATNLDTIRGQNALKKLTRSKNALLQMHQAIQHMDRPYYAGMEAKFPRSYFDYVRQHRDQSLSESGDLLAAIQKEDVAIFHGLLDLYREWKLSMPHAVWKAACVAVNPVFVETVLTSESISISNNLVAECLLKSSKSNDDPLARVVRLLVESPVVQNAANKQELLDAALREAALGRNANNIDVLVESGANVNAVDKDSGMTALHLAAMSPHPGQVRALLKQGAGVDTTTTAQPKLTALHLAVMKNQVKNVAILLEAGANGDLPADEQEDTVLHMAVLRCDVVLTRMLLKAGVNVNLPTRHRMTALHIAIEKQCPDSVVSSILQFHANVFAETQQKITPLQLASEKCELPLIHSLVSAGERLLSKSKIEVENPQETKTAWIHNGLRVAQTELSSRIGLFKNWVNGRDLQNENQLQWSTQYQGHIGILSQCHESIAFLLSRL